MSTGARAAIISGCLLSALAGWFVPPTNAAAPNPYVTFEPSSVVNSGSFAAVLNASVPGDVLLALDVTIEIDTGKMTFGGYAAAGTMTAGFSAFPIGLLSPTASFVQNGQLSPADSGGVIKALLTSPPVSASVPATVRLFGVLGFDQAGEFPFDVSGQVTLAPIPEPAVWMNLLFGLGLIAGVGRLRQLRQRCG